MEFKFNLSFFGFLTIAFIIMQLIGVIDWPWYWLISPLWIGMIFWLAVVAFIVACLQSVKTPKRTKLL